MSFFSPKTTETLLDFKLSTEPDPPQVSPKTGKQETLAQTFVANVPQDVPQVYCTQVKVEFDVGQGEDECLDASYLTCGGANLGFQFTPEHDWVRLTDDPYGTVTFIRPTGIDAQVVKQGYMFEIYDIPVSPVVGTARVTVTETSSADDPTRCTDRTAIFEVAKFPQQFRPPAFEALETSTVDPGGSTHLRWLSDPSAGYEMSWDGKDPVSVKGQSPWPTPRLNEDTQFTLTVSYQAEGERVERHYNVLVQVRSPELSISTAHDRIRSGEGTTLHLEIEHLTNCVLEGGPRPVPIDPKTIVDGEATLLVTPTKTTEYRLRGQDVDGKWRQSDPFTVTVFLKAPAAKADLVFIKTANTEGAVEIHVTDGGRRYQQPHADIKTGFPVADGPNGRWMMAHFWVGGDPGPKRDLVFVRTVDAGSDYPRVSVTPVWAPYRPDLDNAPYTPHPPRPPYCPNPQVGLDRAAKGVWAVMPMIAHRTVANPELVFIQTADTASGYVEVYADNTAIWGYFVESGGPWTSMYPTSDASNGTWRLANMNGAGTLPPDLVFIRTVATDSGAVEVSYATGASGYQARGGRWVTGFDTENASDGTWHLADMSGDGFPDLVFVKTANTESGQVEIYYAAQADRYRNPIGGYTLFPVTDAADGVWEVVRYA